MGRVAHVIVVVPGILGTVLTKDGKKLWDWNVAAIAGALLSGGAEQALALVEPGSQEQSLDDGVVASRMLDNIEGVPGLWKLGGYSRLMAALEQVPGVARDENLFAFPYDWRRDNRVSAHRFKIQSDKWLKDWREKSGNENAKLIMIAHSMGGLVASYFLDCLEGWRDVHTVIYLGVPFRGSANALSFLANGFGVDWLAGRAAFASMDSVYQLLPTYRFVSDGNALARVHEATVPGVDLGRAKAAWDFHEELTTARERNSGIEGYSRIIVRGVAGVKQRTGQSALIDAGKLTIVNAEHGGDDHSGDGTVPRVSTTPVGGDDTASIFVPNTHAALASDAGVIDHLKAIVEGSTIDFSQYRLPGPSGALSLHLPIVVEDGQATMVFAESSIYHQFLEVKVQDASRAVVRDLKMYPQGDLYVAEAKLKPGLYWITVSGERVRPASDVLIVAASSGK